MDPQATYDGLLALKAQGWKECAATHDVLIDTAFDSGWDGGYEDGLHRGALTALVSVGLLVAWAWVWRGRG
jgi:hypothetical protein